MVNKHSKTHPNQSMGIPPRSRFRSCVREDAISQSITRSIVTHISIAAAGASMRREGRPVNLRTAQLLGWGQCVQRGPISRWLRTHEDDTNPADMIALHCPSCTCHAGKQAHDLRERVRFTIRFSHTGYDSQENSQERGKIHCTIHGNGVR